MEPIRELIERAKAASHLPSSYAVAKAVGLEGSQISTIYDWKSGRRNPTQEQVVMLAELAGEPVGKWLALIEAERATSDKLSQAWREVADHLAA